MLLSRSGVREFKPTRDHLFKGFGNLYTGDPAKNMQQRIRVGKWMHGCGYEREHHVIWWGKFKIPLTSAMLIIPRTEKSSNNLSVVVDDLGELCNVIYHSRIF